MLRTHAPSEHDTAATTKADDVAVNVQTAPEDQPLLAQDEQDKDNQKKPVKAKKAAVAAAPPTKVLFLDGVRGLAALLVVTQHSHDFVLYNKTVSSQPNYYCRLFSRFGLLCMLTTVSYQLVEYPSQLLAQRITKALNEQETKGSGGMTVFWGEWANPSKVLAQRLAAVQEAKASGKWMQLLGLKKATPVKKEQPHESAA
ncbi:hypothetical protein PC112_g6869 [Phytophthora cactorum]|nr:hypothetical protein PC112_g6869 [Phytophthora cactorum]